MKRYRCLIWAETEHEDELDPEIVVKVRSHETLHFESPALGDLFASIRANKHQLDQEPDLSHLPALFARGRINKALGLN